MMGKVLLSLTSRHQITSAQFLRQARLSFLSVFTNSRSHSTSRRTRRAGESWFCSKTGQLRGPVSNVCLRIVSLDLAPRFKGSRTGRGFAADSACAHARTKSFRTVECEPRRRPGLEGNSLRPNTRHPAAIVNASCNRISPIGSIPPFSLRQRVMSTWCTRKIGFFGPGTQRRT